MVDFVLTRIPDITERFPEGFNGVDLTPGRYDPYDLYGHHYYDDSDDSEPVETVKVWVSYTDQQGNLLGATLDVEKDNIYDDIQYQLGPEMEIADYGEYEGDETSDPKPRLFQVGDEFTITGLYGGVTTYKVKEIDRTNERILLAETWYDLDGTGERPAEWHKLVSENGNEKALEYYSKLLEQDFWIYANGNNY